MTKRTRQTPRAGNYRCWITAWMVAVLASSGPMALGQSELRFVDSPREAKSSVSLPAPVAANSAPRSGGSEFKLLELSESKTPPLPQFSLTRPQEPTTQVTKTEASSLKFAPAPQSNAAIGSTPHSAVEMRFVDVPKTMQSATQPERIAITPVDLPMEVVIAAPPAIQPSRQVTAEPKTTPASELFATLPQTRPSEFKPRIVSSLEHVPAPVPQHVAAQPVRAAREAAPVYTPPGSELFVAAPPTNWNPPALDYGSALRQVEPPAVVVVAPKSIEPTQIVARELPQSASEMFTFAKSEPIITQPPVEVAPPAKPDAVTPTPIAATPKVPAPEPKVAPKPVSPQVVVAPKVVPTKPVAVVAPPVQEAKPLFVNTPPKLPAAAELETSRVVAAAQPKTVPVPIAPARVASPELPSAATGMFTLGAPEPLVIPTPKVEPQPVVAKAQPMPAPAPVEPPKPQFVAAPPAPARIASATPIAPPTATQRLVPASIAEPTVSQMPFAYDAGKLASEPVAEEVKPTFAPPAVVVPNREQVTVTTEPSEPNVYKFHFAASTNQTPAQLVNTMQPTPAVAAPAPVEVGPEAVPVPYENAGYYGQTGCPYLPGQSGTRALCGVDCGRCGAACNSTWSDATCIPWALFGPGEYVGPARPAHVETYFLRVNDNIMLTFIQSRKKTAEHYRIGVGDELQIEWLQGAANTETPLDRKLLVQPDGTVTLPLIGEVVAAGKTINDFRDEAVKLYSKYQRDPQITVTPLTVNVAVQDVLKAVTAKNQSSGQTQEVKVTPEGTIQAAGIGSVYVQGLTLDELRSELEARYAQAYGPGLTVSPQLTERATCYVFMGGEVKLPGRYTLEGPTTVMQAVALAGGWNNGGNLRQVVIFRRDENWCLKATKIDIRAPYYGNDPCPMNDVWLRDNDLVVVPKSCILCATDLINLYFTRGVYAVFPINYVYDFSSNSGIVPVP